MEGYCRHFDATGDGFVEVGFFRKGEPYGKSQAFNIDGTCVEEGLKEGDVLTKEMHIENYVTRVVKL